jgi:hypothetical protein
MTPQDFSAWVAHMRQTRDLREYDLVKLLGTGSNQISRWKRTGAPLYVALACAAIACGLPAWPGIPLEYPDFWGKV